MKAILTFDLDDYSDKYAHMRCIKALDLCLVINGMWDHLRTMRKYPPEDVTPDYHRALDSMVDKLNQLEEKYNVSAGEITE